MSLTKSNGLLTAAFLLSVGTSVPVFAQQVATSDGIVRITDGKSTSMGRRSGDHQLQQASSKQMTGGEIVDSNGSPSFAMSGGQSGGCENGYCPTGGGCDQGQCQGRHGCLLNEHTCKHSPDYGYSPPAKYPLHRRGVEYTNYYPAKWYGAGGDYLQSQAPMVYQPTDTTQLGFYYQHVPTWLPQPNRLPQRPVPAQWNITAPPVQASRFGGTNSNYGGGCKSCSFGGSSDCSTGYQQSLFGNLTNSQSGFGAHRQGFGMRKQGFGSAAYCDSNNCCEGPSIPVNSNSNYQTSPGMMSPNSMPSGEVVRPYEPQQLPHNSAPVPNTIVTPPPTYNAPRPIESTPSAMNPFPRANTQSPMSIQSNNRYRNSGFNAAVSATPDSFSVQSGTSSVRGTAYNR